MEKRLSWCVGVGVRLIRETLLSYDNVSLIPNYPVGSKLLSLNKHIWVM